MKSALVSVNIPTLNSAETLPTTLRSIAEQTYPRIEVIVADTHSSDSTPEIVSGFGARLVETRDKLLGARRHAFVQSRGDYILLLDSDQVLERTTVARCVALMDQFDMLMLEEDSYKPKTWVQSLFQADRRMVAKIGQSQYNPQTGAMLPRFYRKNLLGPAFERIPRHLLRGVVAHDHAIIYLEASRLSSRIGFVPRAVYSTEPDSLYGLWKKNFRYGQSVTCLRKTPYWSFVWRKTRRRAEREGLTGGSASTALLFLKSLAYATGFATASAVDLLRFSVSSENRTSPMELGADRAPKAAVES